ncbi:PREDICTED: D-tyrosyl-tRNA(Tyr) deacylase 1-like [Amphimedon queenslandica]|uniref:D-aminoacyl-tRNA deacylase n=1 Tax=Amphimedon queenslandica TaxID=400682 RepID=A0A1X7VPH7_AMPQE|nr:PREDICTED: D-tyrosyl-tRNA(Tyr) deacylase 1-like [Amphimedon queenslandica]|eukprot:XP_011409356.1 PREDICTED: D-tyrosyl-tRNA(Tyr) deacylase 1-like [Amphimedon queenslandica]
MKILVQRVTSASVTVDGKVISSIGKGVCVLLGISRKDTSQELEWTVRKLLNLRIFQDPGTNKQWEKSVVDLGLEILCVSQFTLCHVLKGNKPDFHNAMKAEHSSEMYREFLALLGSNYNPDLIKGGEFGAYMNVRIENDGPVTLDIESPSFPPPKERKPQGSSASQEKDKANEEHKQTDDS